MKKLVFIVVLFLSIGGGAMFYLKTSTKIPEQPASFLPDEVLVYFNQKNLGEKAANFRGKPLAEAIDSINFVKLALDIELPLQTVYAIREIQDFLYSKKAKILFDEFLSKNFTVALLQDNRNLDHKEFFKNNLLLFAEPRHKLSLIATFSNLAAKDMRVSSSQYGIHHIFRIPIDENNTFAAVEVENLMIGALEERTLRRALDRFDEHRANLKENYFFNVLRKKQMNAYLFCFFSMARLRQQFNRSLSKDSALQAQFLSYLDDWQGFTAGAYSVTDKNEYDQDVLTLHFNANKLSNRAKKFLKIKPQKNKIIAYAPGNALLYYWTNTFDLLTMWKIYVEQSRMDKPTLTAVESNIAATTGTTLDELLKLTKNTIHLIVGKSSEVDFVPVPNFTIIFQLHDADKTAAVLQHFLTNNGIPHQIDSYRGIPFTFWGDEIRKGLQPAYAIYNNTLYLFSSVRMYKKIVDTIKDGNGLIENKNFRHYAYDLLLENNSTVYMQFSELIESIKDLVKWGGIMLAIQDGRTAYKSKIIINDFILPVLDGLRMYSLVATRSYFDAGKITIESNIIRSE